MNNKLLTSGLVAGLVAGSGAGFVLSSGGFAGASSTGITGLAGISENSAVSAALAVDDPIVVDSTTGTGDEARPDRSTRLAEVLQPLVDDGTITADQLNAIVTTLDAAGPLGRGDGPGRGGVRGIGGDALDAVAEALGVTADELQTAVQGGQTLAEVAAAQGVDVQTVIDTLVTQAGAHLAEHVADGDLTQDEADAKLAELTTTITDAVNNGGGFGRGPGRGEMGGRGHHGMDDDGDASTDAPA